MSLTHAFELLNQVEPLEADVVACFGSDRTLRTWVVQHLAGDSDYRQLDAAETEWSDLRDDLATGSLFDQGNKRTIILRDADKFVSQYRGEIEKHIARPSVASRLVLDLESLPANTRLYKGIAKDHLLVACHTGSDGKPKVTAAQRRGFLTKYVAPRHQTRLAASAADALIEMLGEDIGMLDTELAKLASYLPIDQTIEEELVRDIVAGWQGKTVWQITDAIAEGNTAEALRQLDKLMSGGNKPIALLPQIAWSLRRLAMATAMVEHQEKQGQRASITEALRAVGVRRPDQLERSNKQLRAIGRSRGNELLPWLLDADLRLKGTHSSDGRDRFLLEYLVTKLAHPSRL